MKRIIIGALMTLTLTSAFAESLWNKSDNKVNLFADKKARDVGDIVTIVVTENTQASDELDTAYDKEQNVDMGITSFFNAGEKLFGLDDSGAVRYPRGSIDASNDFSSSGDRSRKSTMAAQVSATVKAVQANGNLVIEGRRSIILDGETKNIILTGVIRPDDIAGDNTVTSSSVADAQITFEGFGTITDATQPGILTKVLNILPIF